MLIRGGEKVGFLGDLNGQNLRDIMHQRTQMY